MENAETKNKNLIVRHANIITTLKLLCYCVTVITTIKQEGSKGRIFAQLPPKVYGFNPQLTIAKLGL